VNCHVAFTITKSTINEPNTNTTLDLPPLGPKTSDSCAIVIVGMVMLATMVIFREEGGGGVMMVNSVCVYFKNNNKYNDILKLSLFIKENHWYLLLF